VEETVPERTHAQRHTTAWIRRRPLLHLHHRLGLLALGVDRICVASIGHQELDHVSAAVFVGPPVDALVKLCPILAIRVVT
jgi:hypothetical protein